MTLLPITSRMQPDAHEAAADHPAGIGLVRHLWLAEEPRVVLDQPSGVLRADEDAVEVHEPLPAGGPSIPDPGLIADGGRAWG